MYFEWVRMLQGSSVTDSHENDGGPEFAEVFVIYWLGATVVTLNIKLLGGSMYVYSIYGVSFCHAVLCISTAYAIVLSVCSSCCTLSKWINVSSEFFHHRVATPFCFFRTKLYGNIQTGTPLMGASNECSLGRQKSWFSTNIWLSDWWLVKCNQQFWQSSVQ